MGTLVLTDKDVRRFLDMPACIDLMRDTLATLSEGDGFNPLRWAARLPDKPVILGLMPGALGQPRAIGIKALAIFPENSGTEYDPHQGLVLLFDPEHGFPIAILDASSITEIRTAAVSAAATRVLASEEAECLAILGSGVQAKSHLRAMLAVRPIRSVRVYSPNAEHCQAFVKQAPPSVDVSVSESAQAAVEGAHVVCVATSSPTPVLEGSWLTPGTHVNTVGACLPHCREVDGECIARSRVFVDRVESAENEAGDILLAREEGAVPEAGGIAGEIGDAFRGVITGRSDPNEITLFKSLGIAVEDLAAAHLVVERARAAGVGTEIDLGGRVHGGH